ncbi:MAG: DUF2851 family protein [Bacteroidia bacterium]
MNEELLQYIWMAGLFNANNLKSTDGQDIIVYKRGRLNANSGPDFSNANIRIGDTEWVGNVEIHLNSDEWYQHKHHLDKGYNTTILHVVLKCNAQCVREDGSELICIELNDRIEPAIIQNYESLKTSTNWVACENSINKIDHFTIEQTLDRQLINRLERKCLKINEWMTKGVNDWNDVLYHSLARSFGFNTNSEAFEQVALNLPLNLLIRNKNDSNTIDSLVFGVAGYLEDEIDEVYFNTLKKEWKFLQKKHKLFQLEKSSFKFMRMRPGNFPCMRLAQFASLAVKCPELFIAIQTQFTLENIYKLFEISPNPYWQTHYHFNKESNPHNTSLSKQAIHHIIINTIVPVFFAFGKHIGDAQFCEQVINLLHKLPAEQNNTIKKWKSINIHAKDAFHSQALLELKNENCDLRKCLNCKIGTKVLNL